jgi:hypothetical protein
MSGKTIRGSRAYLGRVRISRKATLGRELVVAGTTDLQGGATVTGGLLVDDLTVTGTVVLPPLTLSDLTVSGTLTVGGLAALNGGATTTNLTATGVTHLDSLEVDSDAGFDANVNVMGLTTLTDWRFFGYEEVSSLVLSSSTFTLGSQYLYTFTSATSLAVTLPDGALAGRIYRVVALYQGATGPTLTSWSIVAPSDLGMTVVKADGTVLNVTAGQTISGITNIYVDIYMANGIVGWIVTQRLTGTIVVT